MNINPSEFALIDWIKARPRPVGPARVGIGDDCAVLGGFVGEPLVTVDLLMDGVHFRLIEAGPAAVGRKAMGVNLSDIAAMAGVPTSAVVAVALPRRRAGEVARGLVEGLDEMAQRFGVEVVGGDTNAWDGPLVICITVLGHATARGPVLRSGARPGDAILVTGPLGGSLSGRHLSPNPRVREALAIHERVPIHAMIDLSDGLSSDLGHILAASGGLGATLKNVPIHPDVPADARAPIDHALDDGEDFELCLCLDPADASLLLDAPPPGVELYRVGTVEARPGLRVLDADGTPCPRGPGGFDHLAGAR